MREYYHPNLRLEWLGINSLDTIKQILIRDYIIRRLLTVEGATLNGAWTAGSCEDRLPNNINVSFKGISGAALATILGAEGIAVSTGSACNSGNGAEPSYVLTAMGKTEGEATSAIRITISERTTPSEAQYICDKIIEIVASMRGIDN